MQVAPLLFLAPVMNVTGENTAARACYALFRAITGQNNVVSRAPHSLAPLSNPIGVGVRFPFPRPGPLKKFITASRPRRRWRRGRACPPRLLSSGRSKPRLYEKNRLGSGTRTALLLLKSA